MDLAAVSPIWPCLLLASFGVLQASLLQLRRGAVLLLRGGTGLGWIKHRPEPASPGHEQMRIREPKGSTSLLLALSLLAPSKPTSTETFFWSRRWVEFAEHCAVVNDHSPAAQCDCIQHGGPANQCRHRWCRVASIVTLSVRLGSWRVSSARMSHSGVVVAASVAKRCPLPPWPWTPR